MGGWGDREGKDKKDQTEGDAERVIEDIKVIGRDIKKERERDEK